MACKPDSVRGHRPLDGHSSGPDVTGGFPQPTRNAGLKRPWTNVHAFPIRPCSRWGLPCHPCCHERGGLLLHRFTVTRIRRTEGGPSILCGAFPRVSPAGRYPAPLLHGVRTFLTRHGMPGATIQPSAMT